MGYEDETWWSRFEQPSLHSWAEAGEPMRLLQKEAKKDDDPDPKALSFSRVTGSTCPSWDVVPPGCGSSMAAR